VEALARKYTSKTQTYLKAFVRAGTKEKFSSGSAWEARGVEGRKSPCEENDCRSAAGKREGSRAGAVVQAKEGEVSLEYVEESKCPS